MERVDIKLISGGRDYGISSLSITVEQDLKGGREGKRAQEKGKDRGKQVQHAPFLFY